MRKDHFYKQLLTLVLPIALQNLMSAAVNSADTIMLNYVSQTALSAVSLAGQVMFVLRLFFYEKLWVQYFSTFGIHPV